MEHFNLNKKLHTDVLEEKYGPIHSEIIRHDDSIREVHMLDEKGVSRTYALTFLTFDKSDNEVATIDEEIKNGGLIGKTFRSHGYEIRKNVVSVFTVELPEALRKRMQTNETHAKARLSEFYAKKKDENPFIYGIVSEIYSPDFRPAIVNQVDLAQDNPITEAFEASGVSKQDIWERLGEGMNFQDIKEKREEAKRTAISKEYKLQQEVVNYLSHI